MKLDGFKPSSLPRRKDNSWYEIARQREELDRFKRSRFYEPLITVMRCRIEI